ncbi:MAG: hypothetical protein IPL26_14690 [Leptospiraceae bacterium]|nr:hypothetical protein [Leptospiraceae bacterium]
MKVGDQVKLIKKTFMQNGIFILTNSIVEIMEIEENKFHVLYNDKEGHPHTLKNLSAEDLQKI